MTDQALPRGNNYESILEAYAKGELWPTGPCSSTGCSSERTIDLNSTKRREQSTNDSLRAA